MKIESDPFTLNNHYMSDYKEKFLTHYRRVRRDARTRDGDLGAENVNKEENEGVTAEALSLLVRLRYEVTKQNLDRLLKQDTMEPALAVMSSVRAYFQGMSLSSKNILLAEIHVSSGL